MCIIIPPTVSAGVYYNTPTVSAGVYYNTPTVSAGTAVAQVKLAAGDDAGDVQWMEVLANNKLYASHKHFIQEVAERRGAAWEA